MRKLTRKVSRTVATLRVRRYCLLMNMQLPKEGEPLPCGFWADLLKSSALTWNGAFVMRCRQINKNWERPLDSGERLMLLRDFPDAPPPPVFSPTLLLRISAFFVVKGLWLSRPFLKGELARMEAALREQYPALRAKWKEARKRERSRC